MAKNTIRIAMSLWLLTAPAMATPQEASLYFMGSAAPSHCPTSSPTESLGNFEGRVRLSCDMDFKSAFRLNITAARSHANFISSCSKACPPRLPQSPSEQVPQLTDLGAEATAAPSSAASSASAEAGAASAPAATSVAAAAAPAGVSSALGGLAASSLLIGTAISTAATDAGQPGPTDPPASP